MLPHYLATGAVKEVPYPPRNKHYVLAAQLEPKAKGGYHLVVPLAGYPLAGQYMVFESAHQVRNFGSATMCTCRLISGYKPGFK